MTVVDIPKLIGEIELFYVSSASSIDIPIQLFHPINSIFILPIYKQPTLQETVSIAIGNLTVYMNKLYKVTAHTIQGDKYEFVGSSKEKTAFINYINSKEYNNYTYKNIITQQFRI